MRAKETGKVEVGVGGARRGGERGEDPSFRSCRRARDDTAEKRMRVGGEVGGSGGDAFVATEEEEEEGAEGGLATLFGAEED